MKLWEESSSKLSQDKSSGTTAMIFITENLFICQKSTGSMDVILINFKNSKQNGTQEQQVG